MQRFLSPEGIVGLSVHGLSIINSGAYKYHTGWRKA